MPGRRGKDYIPLLNDKVIEVGSGLTVTHTRTSGYRGGVTDNYKVDANPVIPPTTVAVTTPGNTINVTVNGVTGTNANIIDTNTLTSAVNTMTNTTNGIAGSAPIINTNTLTKPTTNTIQSTVNGVASVAQPIIATNVTTVTNAGISATVNGIVSNVAPIFATAIPIADNEVDTAIRTGIVGTSLLAARQDHNHPIRRQVAPTAPVITVGGTGFTLLQTLSNGTTTDEESVTFFITLQVTQTISNAWNFFTVPNIAGYQRAEVTPTGSYRYTGNPTNDTTAPIDQTMVNAPSMNMEWSYYFNGTGYMNVPNRTGATGYYISLKVKYVRI